MDGRASLSSRTRILMIIIIRIIIIREPVPLPAVAMYTMCGWRMDSWRISYTEYAQVQMQHRSKTSKSTE